MTKQLPPSVKNSALRHRFNMYSQSIHFSKTDSHPELVSGSHVSADQTRKSKVSQNATPLFLRSQIVTSSLKSMVSQNVIPQLQDQFQPQAVAKLLWSHIFHIFSKIKNREVYASLWSTFLFTFIITSIIFYNSTPAEPLLESVTTAGICFFIHSTLVEPLNVSATATSIVFSEGF